MSRRALIVAAIAGCSGSGTGGVPDAPWNTRPDPIPPAGVVAWFSLNNTTADNSANHFAIYSGGPFAGFFAEGYHGGGCHFDGTLGYALVDVTASSGANLDFPGPFTVALWLRPERVPSDFEVIASRSYGTSTDSSFALAIDSTMRLRYDSQGRASLLGTTSLVPGEWAHVALTYDGATKRVFVDGALDATGAAAVPVTWDDVHRYVLFGADEESSPFMVGHRLEATLDDVMLFDRALDAVELAALAAQ